MQVSRRAGPYSRPPQAPRPRKENNVLLTIVFLRRPGDSSTYPVNGQSVIGQGMTEIFDAWSENQVLDNVVSVARNLSGLHDVRVGMIYVTI